MMNRRPFLCGLTLWALTAPHTAEAQQRAGMPRVGVLRLDSPPQRAYTEFLQGLRELGYIDGRNIALVVRWAEDKLERLPALATELVRLKVTSLSRMEYRAFGPPGTHRAPSPSSWVVWATRMVTALWPAWRAPEAASPGCPSRPMN
jgi:hypothetical protein